MNAPHAIARRRALPDCAAQTDDRQLPIEQVGIKRLRWPVTVMDRGHGSQQTVAELDLAVGLPADARGTHMSRFLEVLQDLPELTLRSLPTLLSQVQRRLEAEEAHLRAHFPYFVDRRAPVSGARSKMDVDCTFHASRKGDAFSFALEVVVPVTSLCPCSKAISRYGAHNQRSEVKALVSGSEFVWIEEVVEAVEACASAPLYPLLKREDEKFVTEQAYDNPRFVEDLAREVTLALRRLHGVSKVEVEVENFESIHNHSAWAQLRWEEGVEPAGAAPAVPGPPAEPAAFGAWLRQRRMAQGLSQAEAARAIGITSSFLSRVEKGDKRMSEAHLGAAAELLGVEPARLKLAAGVVPDDLLRRIQARPEGFLTWAAGVCLETDPKD